MPYGQPSKIRILAASAIAITAPLDTQENILATVPIVGGSMGPNGILRITSLWSMSIEAGTDLKTCRVRFGGILGVNYGAIGTGSARSLRHQVQIANRNAENSQIAFTPNNTSFAQSTVVNLTDALDTSVDQDLVFTGQKVAGANTLILESFLVELIRP